jgi:FKBP-type peptidyl-prolyl cis-trans isomerase FklB
MKTLLRTVIMLVLPTALSFAAPAPPADDKPAASFKDDREKASYALGSYFGNQIKRNSLEDVDLDVIFATMKDVLAGKPAKLTDQQANEAIRAYQTAQRAKVAQKNEKEADDFLAANKNKSGVKTKTVTLQDGKTAEMQYKVIKEGTGEIPKETDTVRVNYRGTLINGKEFDSNTKHGSEPAKFPVTRVVKGWTEALQMMKVGSKWELYLPASLAYGERGFPPDIAPGAALIFEMELVGIEPPPPPAPAAQPAQPLTSDIIRVPSAEELKKGAKIEVLKPEDVEKAKREAEQQEKEKQQKKP